MSDDCLPVTVIVPALNAARMLAATVESVGNVTAVIVVDGGSRDGTESVASSLEARVVTAPKGRGTQIAAGVAAADAGWLLILHADTVLDPAWRRAARDHMAGGPGKAGYFTFRLTSHDPRARRLERLVALRCRWFGLPYGDQGLLIHSDLLAAVGGVQPLPLMEDVDLIRRLGRRRIALLDANATTSAEKWERDGWLRRSARNLFCLTLWLVGIPPKLIARIYG